VKFGAIRNILPLGRNLVHAGHRIPSQTVKEHRARPTGLDHTKEHFLVFPLLGDVHFAKPKGFFDSRTGILFAV
jgi:hypothetical protein